MNLTNLVLDILELFTKTYSIFLRKPFLTVKVQYAPQRDRSGKVTEEMIAFTIINESGPEIDIQKVWFLTSFNRPIFSKFIDSKIPIKVSRKDRATYLVPMEELKSVLNNNVGETIIEAVASDQTEHRYAGRADQRAQAEFAK